MKNIIISISENNLSDLESIAESMAKDGLVISNTFEFGVICGSADEDTIERLKARKEVESIVEDKMMRMTKVLNKIMTDGQSIWP
jgi:hypothetical protein